ncbi:hypothetical protein AAFN86_00360 [Roseomonas sp. CAU 1739]|uniref:hypothetical protein n=1 Tax=Roseomonas sp. CAU 1739 TaxID=3140364 RepID=UPI00325BA299
MDALPNWRTLFVLLVLVIPVATAAIRLARAEGGVMTPGFKGWLFVLGAWVWLALLRGLVEFGRMLADSAGVSAHFPWLLRADLVISSVSILLAAACVVAMLRRSASFRWLFPLSAGWVVLSFPLSVLLARFLLDVVYGVRVEFGTVMAALSGELPQWAGGLAAAIGWVLYLRRSRRVAMTFVT